jgi:2-amino-4-hydroxy-6-hydroxymethyldihydropteridine diphosphokinase
MLKKRETGTGKRQDFLENRVKLMIILGLGSNLSSSFGDRYKNIETALSFLKEKGITINKKSSFYESPSYPNISDPKFINIVIEILTDFNPSELASIIISIEEKLERKRNKKNDPRTCDIDIIDYKRMVLDFIYKDMKFSVPHEKLSFRNFVLFPLNEIIPTWIHPKTNDHIGLLIERLPNADKNAILKINNY